MNKKILAMLERTVPFLVFGLLSGFAYFGIIYALLSGYFSTQNKLIIFYFSPAVICGGALVVMKLVKQHREAQNYSKIMMIFWVHAVLMVIAACMTAALFV